ncbi:MAG: cysteine hydrolase [Bacteroidetes bacterium]|nr:cysteine hydrolase [Bacteroidota bacterium]
MRKIILLAAILILGASYRGHAQQALILIDLQMFYFPGGIQPLHEPEAAVQNAAMALAHFRANAWPVVHVQHAIDRGGEIHPLVAPAEGETVITKKEVNAFAGTSLSEVLQSLGVKKLVFAGMQTHMCLEAAVRAARDMGYECIVLSDACATRNLSFDGIEVTAAQVHASTLATLNRTYARVLKTKEFLEAK